MANIVVTSDENKIIVEWNDMSQYADYKNKSYIPRTDILAVNEPLNYSYVEVIMNTLSRKPWWNVSINGADQSLIIDSVDGVEPTDNSHLAELISDLIVL